MYISDTTKKELIRFQEAMASRLAGWTADAKNNEDDVYDYIDMLRWMLFFVESAGQLADGEAVYLSDDGGKDLGDRFARCDHTGNHIE